MPQVFTNKKKIKVIQYGVTTSQEVSFKNVANDIYAAILKVVKR